MKASLLISSRLKLSPISVMESQEMNGGNSSKYFGSIDVCSKLVNVLRTKLHVKLFMMTVKVKKN
nr:hypothetical protein Iba_chr04fCG14580 [Ipomoea batatas]